MEKVLNSDTAKEEEMQQFLNSDEVYRNCEDALKESGIEITLIREWAKLNSEQLSAIEINLPIMLRRMSEKKMQQNPIRGVRFR